MLTEVVDGLEAAGYLLHVENLAPVSSRAPCLSGCENWESVFGVRNSSFYPRKTQEVGVRIPPEQATACSVARNWQSPARPGMRVRVPPETARLSFNWQDPVHTSQMCK